jgi:hypothetical protein
LIALVRALALAALLLFACKGGDDDGDGPNPMPDAGTPDGGDTSVCERWVVDYDLMPAQFDIRDTPLGRGDGTNDVGPGTLRITFPDDRGEPGSGAVTITEYLLELDFTVSDVQTDITMEAGPDECGVAAGTFDGAQIAWSTPIRGYRSHGEITCNAGEVVCAFAMLPDGMPSPRDDTHDQDLMPFIFTSSTSTVIPPNGFIMEYVEIPSDDVSNTFLRFTGRERDRVCVRAPDCP